MVEASLDQENDSKIIDGKKPSEDETKKAFTIDILRLITNAQKQHGLRHGDYQRYRGMNS